MAARDAGKAAGGKPARKAAEARKKAAPSPAERVAALERERDALKAELAAAQERIRSLEVAREQVLNRIDWVIDSLQTLMEE